MSSWSYRGTSLDSLGIVTLVSDSHAMPKPRGGNILIPFQDGRVFVKKYYEQRSLTLGLEINETSLTLLESKMDTVKALLGSGALGALAQTLEDTTVRTLQAESVGDGNIRRISPLDIRMLLEFLAPDPFFRGATLVSDTHVINATPKTFTVTNPGTADERNPKIILTGPLQDTVMTHLTNGCVLTYNGTIASPRVVTIQKNALGKYTATDDLGTNVIGNVDHQGDTAFFVLDGKNKDNAGVNSISVTDATHTTGSIKFEFYPPHF